jgi:hypothetical protein
MDLDANLIRRLARERTKQGNERGLYILGLCHALQSTNEPECVALADELLKAYFPWWRVKPTRFVAETTRGGITIER